MIRTLRPVIAALLALLLFAASPLRADGDQVTVRGGEHDGFGRLVFDWPAPVHYTAKIEAGYLEVRFDRRAAFELSALRHDLEDYISGSQVSADGRSLLLNLKGSFGLKHFTMGPKVVVDLQSAPLEGIVAGVAPIKVPMPPSPPVALERERLDVVRVRGGEHEGFSRLVFDWPSEVGVRLDRRGERLRLIFDRAARFDLSQVTSSPLENVTANQSNRPEGNTEVELELAEGATATSWTDGPLIVIDVKAPGTTVVAEAEEAVPPPREPDPSWEEAGEPVRESAQESAQEPAAADLAEDALAAVPPAQPARQDQPARAQTSPAEPPAQTPMTETRMAETRMAETAGAKQPAAEQSFPEQSADEKPAGEQSAAAEADDGGPTDLLPSAMRDRPAAESPPDATARLAEHLGALQPDAGAAEQAAPEPSPGSQQSPDTAGEAKSEPPAGAGGEQLPENPVNPDDLPELPGAAPGETETAGGAEAATAEATIPEAATAEATAETAAEDVVMPERLEPAPAPLPGRAAPPEGAVALRFNWTSPTAAATFRRGDTVWLVFDRRTKTGLDGRIAKVAPELKPTSLNSSTGTVIRLDVPHRLTPKLVADGTSWVLDLRVRSEKPERPLTIVLDNKTDRPRVLVPLVEPGRLQTFIDPDFGDLVYVAPVRGQGQGIINAHDFPEFQVLASEQGLVVRPKSEQIRISMIGDTVSLEGPDGLLLSARKQRETALAANRGVTPGHRLFDLVAWRRGDLSQFHRQRSELEDAVLGAPRELLGLRRLALARFYFAHGLAPEALGVLELIDEKNHELADDPQVVLMTGASEVLSEYFEKASKTLADPVLGGEPEATLWRAVLAALSGDWPYAAEAFVGTEGLLIDYVPNIRHRMLLLAAEARIEIGDIVGAGGLLGRLRDDRPDTAVLGMADYLEGRRLYLEDDYTRAKRLWDAAAASPDPKASVRARLALIDLALQEQEIEPADAIEELQKLRFAWRGDSFEFALLERLGELQIDRGEYRDGLLTFRQAVSNLPDDPRAQVVTARMRRVFRDLFLGEYGEDLSALRALALYEEFRELTPTGGDGDAVVEELANRLVEVDLLDEAIALLGRQVAYRLEGPEKSRVGARIAELDLMNQDAESAVSALAETIVDDPLPLDLERRRRFLATRALAKMGRYADALQAMGEDESWAALRLRAAVHWQRHDWASAARLLEVMLPARLGPDAAPDREQSEIILALAIAYSLAEDRRGLADLDWRFGSAMALTERKETFDMLTGDLDIGLITSITDELKGVDLIERFLESYPEDWVQTSEATPQAESAAASASD